MKIEILESTPAFIRFKLGDSSYGFANALRRAVISGVETFAIDTVTFYENTSSMFDEYIAHRIGLVPLKSPEGYGEEEEVLFTLEGEGPTTIYSKNLKSNDKYVKVANERIPIIKLAEGQRTKLEGKARQGSGSKSAKFQPGLATYKAMGDKEFEFYIESFGQMEAKDILTRALNVINASLNGIEKGLSK